jgi:hypothetical protein
LSTRLRRSLRGSGPRCCELLEQKFWLDVPVTVLGAVMQGAPPLERVTLKALLAVLVRVGGSGAASESMLWDVLVRAAPELAAGRLPELLYGGNMGEYVRLVSLPQWSDATRELLYASLLSLDRESSLFLSLLEHVVLFSMQRRDGELMQAPQRGLMPLVAALRLPPFEPVAINMAQIEVSAEFVVWLGRAGLFASALHGVSPRLAAVLAWAETRRGISASDTPVYDALLPVVQNWRPDLMAFVMTLVLRTTHWSVFPPARVNALLYCLYDYNIVLFYRLQWHHHTLYKAAGLPHDSLELPAAMSRWYDVMPNGEQPASVLKGRAVKGRLDMTREQIRDLRMWCRRNAVLTVRCLRRWLRDAPGRELEVPHIRLFKHILDVPPELVKHVDNMAHRIKTGR